MSPNENTKDEPTEAERPVDVERPETEDGRSEQNAEIVAEKEQMSEEAVEQAADADNVDTEEVVPDENTTADEDIYELDDDDGGDDDDDGPSAA